MKDISFLSKHLIAYRGIYDNKNIYENTIEAFKVSIKRKNTIYLEVSETKDHKYVVCSDDTLLRLHSLKDKICDLTYEEIDYLCFYHIPLLEEVLELVNGNVSIIIDINVDSKNKELFNILDKYKGKFAIISLSPKLINWVIKNRDYIIGEIVTKRSAFSLDFYFNIVDFKSYNIHYFDNASVKNMINHGEIILGYLINSQDKYDTYKDIFSNLIVDNFTNIDFKK